MKEKEELTDEESTLKDGGAEATPDDFDVTHHEALHLMQDGKFGRAMEKFTKCLKLATKEDDKSREASTINDIAHLLVCKGELDAGLKKYNEAMKKAYEADDIKEISRSYHNLGTFHERKAEYGLALENLFCALAYQKKGDIEARATIDYITGIRKFIKFKRFSEIGKAAYNNIDPELAKMIDIDEFVKETTVRLAEAKVGRNDPCPCGSGKKYKKCCAAKE